MTEISEQDREKFSELLRDHGLIGMLRMLAAMCRKWAETYERDDPGAVFRWRNADKILTGLADALSDEKKQ